MSATKENILSYLSYSDNNENAIKKYLDKLSEMVNNSLKGGVYELNIHNPDRKFEEDFDQLASILDNLDSEFVPYAEITRIIYTSGNTERTDGFDIFQHRFKICLSQKINDEFKNGENVRGKFIILTKSYEHLKLASTQIDSLFLKQEEQIKKQEEQTKKQVEQIKKQSGKIQKLRKQISKETHKLKNLKSSVYGDFIAILGIFSALIFSLFGGFKTFTLAISQISKGISIVRITIILSLLGIIMLCLLFFLLKAIATMSDRKLSLCNEKCIYKKYPFFMYGLTIMTIFLGISLIYDYYVYH
ncbi:MAG: hypothetical protein LKJ22_10490 [Liquorilactobacillus nagelii]|jgi:hypothetical protein|uniref:hypothetical protein n=1 Tax=Liquorilactobacillus nagelii TaxID=82688 RepID=UPI0024313195|nr:hypothetical protein [Liquorilactobacillus nagelii]MCI1922329.1 hypothetical protein [Liquorilactobacillus nagelii]